MQQAAPQSNACIISPGVAGAVRYRAICGLPERHTPCAGLLPYRSLLTVKGKATWTLLDTLISKQGLNNLKKLSSIYNKIF